MSKQTATPGVKLVITLAGLAAGVVGSKLLDAAWGVAFGEQAPTASAQKTSEKDLAEAKKEAKQRGATKQELREMESSFDALPAWKIVLWTAVSGAVISGLRMAAERGAEAGANRLLGRRPESARG